MGLTQQDQAAFAAFGIATRGQTIAMGANILVAKLLN
jgi:hypothetical protein